MDNYKQNVIFNIIRYNGMEEVLKQINALPYAIIKGEPLSVLAYKKIGMRRSGDIDILVPRQYIADLEKILTNNGFCPSLNYNYSDEHLTQRGVRVFYLSSSHQIYSYKKQINKIKLEIDINFDIFWGEYIGKRIDINKFLSDTIEMDIYGHKVKTLPPLKAFVQLCLHHYKGMNSIYTIVRSNGISVKMLQDVYYLLINNQKDISIEKLYHISNDYRIVPYIFYLLYYTSRVFCDDKLKKYVEAFRTVEGENLLDYYGLANNERKRWKIDFRKRLESNNIYDYIKDDLSKDDLDKIERSSHFF